MVWHLFRGQWKRPLCIVLLFVIMLFLFSQRGEMYEWGLLDAQQAYMQKHGHLPKEDFLAMLHEDSNEAAKIIEDIEKFVGYEGEIPEGTMDIMDILSGNGAIMNYDMLRWKKQMLSMPGKMTETVERDYSAALRLERLLYNQEYIDYYIENSQEIMRRGIRRGGEKVVIYETLLEELADIPTDSPLTNTYCAGKLLTYLESDWYLLVLVCLCFFSVFSGSHQAKMTRQVLVSKMGIRKFVASQIGASLLILGIFLCLYYLGVTFAVSNGDFGAIAWNIPVQAVSEYENSLQNATVLEYAVKNVMVKSLAVLCILSLLLWISAVSPNNIVSLLGGGLLFGGCVLFSNAGTEIGQLIEGATKGIYETLPYFITDSGLVHFTVAYGLQFACAALAALALLVFVSPYVMRKVVTA